MSPAGRIYTSWKIIRSALVTLFTSWIPFWVSARKIFFTTPDPMRMLLKKIKSAIYNIIMFINLLWWNLYKLFWKILFVRKYIIWVLLKVNLSVVYHETWCRAQSWMILTVFAMITRFFPNFVFVTVNTSL